MVGTSVGVVKWAFLTHTWQMSSHRVGLQEKDECKCCSSVTNRKPFSFQLSVCFQPRFSAETAVWALSRRLCKSSPTAVVIDAAALWRQLGQAGSLQPHLPPTLCLPHLPELVSVRVPVGCVLFFGETELLQSSGVLKPNPGGE